MHDWPDPLQWQCDGCFRDQQWREAGLHTSPGPLQRFFPLYAVPCCPRSGEGGLHLLPLGWLPLQPALTHSKDKQPANSPPSGSLCQRLRTSGLCRTRSTADAGLLLQGIQALRPDNQSRKDGGAPPTCTILPHPSTITTDEKPLANVEHFKYLGNTISCDGSLDDREIDTRISKAS